MNEDSVTMDYSSTVLNTLGPTTELDEASAKVKIYIENGESDSVKVYLDPFDRERRGHIINHAHDDQTAFFKACLVGNAAVVEYMLKECRANTKLRGLYILQSLEVNERVFPLWVAVCENNFDVVKLLVVHGADINGSTFANSTPLRCACYMDNIKTVEYLVENGASINERSVFGGTCLMNATRGSLELCEFLVNNGASINATHQDGYTALYCATTGCRLDLVNLFLNNGASHFVKIRNRSHIILEAAISGNRAIFDYIQENTVLKPSQLADAFELLGATFVDNNNAIDEALHLWRKAMELRYANPEAPLIKVLPQETTHAYQFFREATTRQECDALVASDMDKIYMCALLTRERILGPGHEETMHGLRYRGAVYADAKHFQRTVDLWKYTYSLQRQHRPSTNTSTLTNLELFVALMKEMSDFLASGKIVGKIQTNDIVDVLVMMVDQLEVFNQVLSVRPLQENTFPDFKKFMILILHIIHAFFVSEGQGTQNELFKAEVKRAVSLGAASEAGESLLHVALNADSSKVDGRLAFKFPSTDVVGCLVKAGANVNALDEEKNTPLHCCIQYWKHQGGNLGNGDKGESLAWLLIEHGAHVDARNSDRETPLDFLRERGSVCPIKHTTLKCLAARAVADTGVDFMAYLPTSFRSFVEMHA